MVVAGANYIFLALVALEFSTHGLVERNVCASVSSGIRLLLDRVSLRNHPSRQVLMRAEICRLEQMFPSVVHSSLCHFFMSFLG